MYYRAGSSGGGLFKLILALLLAYFVYKFTMNYTNERKINVSPTPTAVATETINQINNSISPTYSKPAPKKENKPKTPKEIQAEQGVPIEYMVRPNIETIEEYYPDADPKTLKPENYNGNP